MNLWREGGAGETAQQAVYFLSGVRTLLELRPRTVIKKNVVGGIGL